MSRSKHRPSKQSEQLALLRETRKHVLRLAHGGSLLRGNAKKARPLSTRRPVHLVMHSSLAKGELSFLRKENARRVRAIVLAQAKRFGVRVYEFALVDQHFHLLARITSRKSFIGFLRSVSGLVARAILGAERGAAKAVKFWDSRPFTRVIEDWGRTFRAVRSYLGRPAVDAVGFIPYAGRGRRPKFDLKAISFAPLKIFPDPDDLAVSS